MTLIISEQNSLGNGGGIPQDFSGGFGNLPFEPTFSDQGFVGENLIDFSPSLVPGANPDTFASMLENAFNFVGNLFKPSNTTVLKDPDNVPPASVFIPTFVETSDPNQFSIKIPTVDLRSPDVILNERRAEVERLRQKLVAEGKLKPEDRVPSTLELLPGELVNQAPKTISSVVGVAGDVVQGAGSVVGKTVSEVITQNLPFLLLLGGVIYFVKMR